MHAGELCPEPARALYRRGRGLESVELDVSRPDAANIDDAGASVTKPRETGRLSGEEVRVCPASVLV